MEIKPWKGLRQVCDIDAIGPPAVRMEIKPWKGLRHKVVGSGVGTGWSSQNGNKALEGFAAAQSGRMAMKPWMGLRLPKAAAWQNGNEALEGFTAD